MAGKYEKNKKFFWFGDEHNGQFYCVERYGRNMTCWLLPDAVKGMDLDQCDTKLSAYDAATILWSGKEVDILGNRYHGED